MRIYTKEEVPQRGDEWFAVRSLKLTASNAEIIQANGKGLETLCKDLVTDFVSDIQTETFTTADMQRGIELEPIAREKANGLFKCEYQEIGFVELDNRTGVSPDGVLFDKDGNITDLIEIKSPNDKNFMEQFVSGTIPKKYISQMQMQMMITGAKKCRYFAYNENIKPYYFSKVIEVDVEIQEKLKKGIEHGKQIIDEYLTEYFKKVEGIEK